MTFVAGGYTVTAGASPASVGQCLDGIKLDYTQAGQDIIGDNFGKAVQDTVYQGISEMFLNFTLMEYDATYALETFWPWDATFGDQGVVGRLAKTIGGQIILTAVAGTSAATLPATWTASEVMLALGFPVEMIFAPEHRVIPIRQRVYLNSSDVFFTLT
tara:strand:- start:10835 stop:11311 length:477 start_codon:yes stop_codon:yes gene_type:complete